MSSSRDDFPPALQSLFNNQERILNYPWATASILTECFSEKQSEAALLHWRRSRNIIDTFATTKEVNRHRAIADLAYFRGSLSQARYEQVLSAIGDRFRRRATAQRRPKPKYEDGRILYDGIMAREVRQFRRRSKVQIVLDLFQKAGWSRTIENPWWGDPDQDKVHRTVNDLKKGLKAISFEVTGGGRYIRWIEKH